MAATNQGPVTLLTQSLGSGKTHVLNRLLAENHGKRIAVIEKQSDEVGVDHQVATSGRKLDPQELEGRGHFYIA